MDSKDITIEIVSRTSLRSFDAMRCTSKEINRLTYDSNIVDIHEQRNHIISGLITQRTPSSYSTRYIKEFVPSCESKSLDLGFLSDDARIRASSDHGIIVLERPRIMYYVCKPATKQLIQLPHPKSKYKVDKLSIVVMDSKPLRYKIVRFSRPDNIVHIVVRSSTQERVNWNGD
ncbi:hypothetical protein M8C21_026108 [Ambrosia artemisiifolia]|uniref:Uncharacterized protein n=1 Tax=Ambrosia artemisiifolia TaxID=4212 RepID=A0AAD5CTS0_AMBAR|nr:hypothetical protein M8C21_026108 [Ambrosia artemisiifolia]